MEIIIYHHVTFQLEHIYQIYKICSHLFDSHNLTCICIVYIFHFLNFLEKKPLKIFKINLTYLINL
jgi:hypothetical protein